MGRVINEVNREENFIEIVLDGKEYLLPKKRDLIILKKIKLLEEKKLGERDREVLKLIKTQLEEDWRKPIINYLNKLININK